MSEFQAIRDPKAVSVGDRAPEVLVEGLERQDFVRYAGASGDFNPIHYDVPYAREAGNDDVFAQGMLTAGFGAHLVADWFGIANVKSYGVRFQSRVFPGDSIRVTGEVTEIDDSGGVVTIVGEITAETLEGEVVLTGSASAEYET